MSRARVVVAALALACSAACSGPAEDDRHRTPTPPRDQFPPLGDALHAHCGSLDCHGTRARNLTLFGINGLRLDGITGTGPTTEAEHEQNFQSVVLLEPEKLGLVVHEGGSRPERLTLVRKARGSEAHKGGTPMPAGSAGDRCLRSWLAQAVDLEACAEAAEVPGPEWP